MPVRDRLLAALVAVLWGGNFLAIDVGLDHFPPLFLAALRFAVIAVPTVLLVGVTAVLLPGSLGCWLLLQPVIRAMTAAADADSAAARYEMFTARMYPSIPAVKPQPSATSSKR